MTARNPQESTRNQPECHPAEALRAWVGLDGQYPGRWEGEGSGIPRSIYRLGVQWVAYRPVMPAPGPVVGGTRHPPSVHVLAVSTAMNTARCVIRQYYPASKEVTALLWFPLIRCAGFLYFIFSGIRRHKATEFLHRESSPAKEYSTPE